MRFSLIGLLLIVLQAFGRVGSGTITGTVTDPAGAVVVDAFVEAKNEETGVVFRGVSASAGNYLIPDLPVGTYTVRAAVTGFKTYTHAKLPISTTQAIREDIALQVGTTAKSVTATAKDASED